MYNTINLHPLKDIRADITHPACDFLYDVTFLFCSAPFVDASIVVENRAAMICSGVLGGWEIARSVEAQSTWSVIKMEYSRICLTKY
jgi:hypothetical protein